MLPQWDQLAFILPFCQVSFCRLEGDKTPPGLIA